MTRLKGHDPSAPHSTQNTAPADCLPPGLFSWPPARCAGPGHARGGAASWQNTGQRCADPANGPMPRAACEESGAPFEGGMPRQKRKTRQAARRQRGHAIKASRDCRHGIRPMHGAKGQAPRPHPGMPHKAPCSGARQFPRSPARQRIRGAWRPPTPKLHRHGPRTGRRNLQAQKNPPGEPGGLIVETLRHWAAGIRSA